MLAKTSARILGKLPQVSPPRAMASRRLESASILRDAGGSSKAEGNVQRRASFCRVSKTLGAWRPVRGSFAEF